MEMFFYGQEQSPDDTDPDGPITDIFTEGQKKSPGNTDPDEPIIDMFLSDTDNPLLIQINNKFVY